MGHVGSDLLAGLSFPDDEVTVACFLSGLWDKESSTVLAHGNIGIRQQKMLQQENVILFLRTEQIFCR